MFMQADALTNLNIVFVFVTAPKHPYITTFELTTHCIKLTSNDVDQCLEDCTTG